MPSRFKLGARRLPVLAFTELPNRLRAWPASFRAVDTRASPSPSLRARALHLRAAGPAMTFRPPSPSAARLWSPTVGGTFGGDPSPWTWRTDAALLDGLPLVERREIELYEQCTGLSYSRETRRKVRRLIVLAGRRAERSLLECGRGLEGRHFSRLEAAPIGRRGCGLHPPGR